MTSNTDTRPRLAAALRIALLAWGLGSTTTALRAQEAATEAAPRPPSSSELARRPDQRRPTDPFQVDLGGRPLVFSGEYELTVQRRRNFDLTETDADRRNRLSHELTLEAMLRASPSVTAFAALNGTVDRDTFREGGTPKRESTLARDQAWIYIDEPGGAPFALQAGRVALSEPRTWWWDTELDAARLYFGGATWLVETGLARELFKLGNHDRGIAADQRGVLRWFGRAAHEWRPRHTLELYWLLARDRSEAGAVGSVVDPDAEDPSDARLAWTGARLAGDERFAGGGRARYWIDLAQVRGRETAVSYDDVAAGSRVRRVSEGQRVAGSAYDAGLSWTLDAPLRPTLTAGLARASGDGSAHSFRQTGLQENKMRFGGVTRLHQYGELLRPELSNLRIATAAFGVRPTADSSIDLVWHRLWQVSASKNFSTERLDASPRGVDTHLGHEVDAVFGWRVNAAFETALRLGEFRAGQAFGSREGERARYAELTGTLNF